MVYTLFLYRKTRALLWKIVLKLLSTAPQSCNFILTV